MDIHILLALQDFRNGAGGILADFLLKMTFLGELNTVIIMMAIIYWSVSKELGIVPGSETPGLSLTGIPFPPQPVIPFPAAIP